jgi:hypothetical protein
MKKARQTTSKDLWRCPKCGRHFVNRNQWHSCGSYSVESFLEGKSSAAIELFHRFAELVEACGPVLIAPAKSRIGFQVSTIFAAVNRLSDRGLYAHVVLSRRLESPRFRRIETLGPKPRAPLPHPKNRGAGRRGSGVAVRGLFGGEARTPRGMMRHLQCAGLQMISRRKLDSDLPASYRLGAIA